MLTFIFFPKLQMPRKRSASGYAGSSKKRKSEASSVGRSISGAIPSRVSSGGQRKRGRKVEFIRAYHCRALGDGFSTYSLITLNLNTLCSGANQIGSSVTLSPSASAFPGISKVAAWDKFYKNYQVISTKVTCEMGEAGANTDSFMFTMVPRYVTINASAAVETTDAAQDAGCKWTLVPRHGQTKRLSKWYSMAGLCGRTMSEYLHDGNFQANIGDANQPSRLIVADLLLQKCDGATFTTAEGLDFIITIRQKAILFDGVA